MQDTKKITLNNFYEKIEEGYRAKDFGTQFPAGWKSVEYVPVGTVRFIDGQLHYACNTLLSYPTFWKCYETIWTPVPKGDK